MAIYGYELAFPDEAGILNPRATIIGLKCASGNTYLRRCVPAGRANGRVCFPPDRAVSVGLVTMTGMGVRRERRRFSSGCEAHPAIRSSRKQPEQAWRRRNV